MLVYGCGRLTEKQSAPSCFPKFYRIPVKNLTRSSKETRRQLGHLFLSLLTRDLQFAVSNVHPRGFLSFFWNHLLTFQLKIVLLILISKITICYFIGCMDIPITLHCSLSLHQLFVFNLNTLYNFLPLFLANITLTNV